MTTMWTHGELSSSLNFGELYAVARVDNYLHLARVRKKKGEYCLERTTKKFHYMADVVPGQLLFRERSGRVTQLAPEGSFAENIKKAIARAR